ncbi:phage head-tail joining protein [Modicisalibacter luteus]|uniref:Phage head-tail joining protein n=1 Tax=Modicisalibacter luteus TaxID=453962 RepID=A0ABV7M315_9GAMM|nr:gpW family head-tail joining protein [Halomonas lutea]GHA85378.1 hypothetical protein GCM10007159_03100 [Halomonas lutea]
MAYTADDLASIRRAIVELARGQRVTTVTHNGRTVQYAQSDIDALRDLAREIALELKHAGGRRRSRTHYVTTSKGL